MLFLCTPADVDIGMQTDAVIYPPIATGLNIAFRLFLFINHPFQGRSGLIGAYSLPTL